MRKIGLFLVMISASAFILCGCSSSSQLDELRVENAELIAELEEARSEIDKANSELEEMKSELAGTKSELDVAKAELETTKLGLDNIDGSGSYSGDALSGTEAADLSQTSFKVKDVHEDSDGAVVVTCDNGKEVRESSVDVHKIVGDSYFSVKNDYDYEVADLDGDGCDEVILTMLIVNNTADGVGELIILDIDESGVATPVFDTPSAKWRDDYFTFGSYLFDGDRISFDTYYKKDGEMHGDTLYLRYNDGEWILEK